MWITWFCTTFPQGFSVDTCVNSFLRKANISKQYSSRKETILILCRYSWMNEGCLFVCYHLLCDSGEKKALFHFFSQQKPVCPGDSWPTLFPCQTFYISHSAVHHSVVSLSHRLYFWWKHCMCATFWFHLHPTMQLTLATMWVIFYLGGHVLVCSLYQCKRQKLLIS